MPGPTDSTANADVRPRAWLDVTALLVFQALMLQGFGLHLDAHPDDEVVYQELGHALATGAPSARMVGYGPLFSPLYALLELFGVTGVPAQDAMTLFVPATSTLALWFAARAFVPRTAALLVAMWWASSSYVLTFPLHIFPFTAMLFMVGIGLAARGRTTMGLAMLTLAALNRLENMPWLLAAAAGVAVLGQIRSDRRMRNTGAVFAAVGVTLFLVLTSAPGAKHHAWLAFIDHYVGLLRPGPTGLPMIGQPLEEQFAIGEEVFPGADSVPSALLANPGAFVDHVLRSTAHAPAMIAGLVALGFAHVPALQVTVIAIALLLALVAAGAAIARRPPPTGAAPRAPTVGHVVLWTSWCVVPPLLAIFPKSGFVQAASVSLLLGVTMAACRGARFLAHRLPAALRRHELVLVAALLLGAIIGGPFVQSPASLCQTRESVVVLQRNTFPAGARLAMFGGHGPRFLAGIDVELVDMTEFLVAPEAADHVLFTSFDIASPRGAVLLERLTTGPWRIVDAAWATTLFARTGGRGR